jgi:hypothetical protein
MRTRTPAARAGIALAALALVVALFVVLAGSDEDGTGSAAPHPQGAAEHRSDASAAPPPEDANGGQPARRQPATIERIVVRGGKPVGGVRRLEYESGERVRFSVRSNVPDEVHVHGFDLTKDVPANGSVRFAFRADLEGVFDIELHHAGIAIAELRIKP